ncbi:hypothetical protein F511_04830 [Dorcoceras hygrometricum]|uniref:Uncharacterized protein n=1 Tax=Dorcoceras hygrometricum TaxID=472368 RepID=A0A2Z7B299_9LAMI|nr:hypothetical protein F511_04830 [Dorcoceras hygrometricum]
MGNSLRCCLACVLPFGALDLIRIVHLNGYVEELSGPATAGQVLQNNPDHVLTKPSSEEVGRRILILSPDSELKRGSIYFLIPTSSLPANVNNKRAFGRSGKGGKKEMTVGNGLSRKTEKRSSHKARASVGLWRPNLHSISED